MVMWLVVLFPGFYDGTDCTPEQRGQCPAGWEPTGGTGKSVFWRGVWDPGANAAAELPLGGAQGGEHGQAVPVSHPAWPLLKLKDWSLVLAASQRNCFASICKIFLSEVALPFGTWNPPSLYSTRWNRGNGYNCLFFGLLCKNILRFMLYKCTRLNMIPTCSSYINVFLIFSVV